MEKRFLIGLAVVMLAVSPAFGGPITDLSAMFGLFNTGVGTYTGFNGTTSTAFTPVVVTTVSPAGWVANSVTSSWIGPVAVAVDTPAVGYDVVYSYSMNFDLTGYDPATFAAVLGVTGDDAIAVFLNGVNIRSTWTPSPTAFTTVNISGAGAGVNLLVFHVTNVRPPAGAPSGNPTGLNVRFTSASAESVIPEPGTIALMGAGLLALGLFRKRS